MDEHAPPHSPPSAPAELAGAVPQVEETAAALARQMLDNTVAAPAPPAAETGRDTDTELQELRELARNYGLEAEFIQNGNAGVIVRTRPLDSRGQPESAPRQAWEGSRTTAPIANVDADDTLFAFSPTKAPRQDLYEQFARERLGHELPPAVLERLMGMADKFSRWDDGSPDLYHFQSHKWAAAWAVEAMRGAAPEETEQRLADIQRTLDSIAASRGSNTPPDGTLPFRFRGNELLLDGFAPHENIDAVFEPMLNPDPYDEILYQLYSLRKEGVKVNIFTLGEPKFQLEKLLRLRQKMLADGKYGWPFEYIFLTRASKGEFVSELANTAARDPQLRDDLLSPDLHAFALLDDDKKQLDDFMARKEELAAKTGAQLCVLRSLRPNTKTWARRDDAYRDYGEMGILPDRDNDRRVLILGPVEDSTVSGPRGRRQAHIDALSNVRLQLFTLFAHALGDYASAHPGAYRRFGVEAQQTFLWDNVFYMERFIESANDVPFMTL